MLVAGAGIVINALTAWLFAAGRKGDINIRGAFLHMVADAAVSAGAVVAGAFIVLTERTWIDPAVSLLIGGVILWSTWSLLKDSIRMSLAAVPPGVQLEAVRELLQERIGVTSIHDLHVWPMSTTEAALTCHLVMPAGHPGDVFLMQVTHELQDRFGIGHVTLQIETSESTQCALAPDHR